MTKEPRVRNPRTKDDEVVVWVVYSKKWSKSSTGSPNVFAEKAVPMYNMRASKMTFPSINLEYVFYQIYRFFTAPFNLNYDGTGAGFEQAIFVLKIVMWAIALISLFGIIWFFYKMKALEAEMEKNLYRTTKAAAEPVEIKNREWERYLKMIDGNNPAEWRIALLEADKMLEALTIQLGFPGESLGERLKNADISRMTTLESAWEAHKVRNRIAHEAQHVLTKREARRALTLFEKVFREFGLI